MIHSQSNLNKTLPKQNSIEHLSELIKSDYPTKKNSGYIEIDKFEISKMKKYQNTVRNKSHLKNHTKNLEYYVHDNNEKGSLYSKSIEILLQIIEEKATGQQDFKILNYLMKSKAAFSNTDFKTLAYNSQKICKSLLDKILSKKEDDKTTVALEKAIRRKSLFSKVQNFSSLDHGTGSNSRLKLEDNPRNSNYHNKIISILPTTAKSYNNMESSIYNMADTNSKNLQVDNVFKFGVNSNKSIQTFVPEIPTGKS